MPNDLSPLRGLGVLFLPVPRLTPRAIIYRPSGAEQNRYTATMKMIE